MLNDLTQLGLSADEAKVYLALLELGGGYVSQVAKKAGKHRATCYYTLSNLVEKGFATKLEKGSYQHFTPQPPQTIISHAKRRFEVAQALVPQLLSIQNTLAKKPKITFYEGRLGVESIFEDMLSAETSVVGFTNLSLVLETFPDYFKRYTREKIKKGIKTRYLSPLSKNTSRQLKSLLGNNLERDYFEVLFINPTAFPFENEVVAYGSKVAIMSLSPRESMAVLIESQSYAQTTRAIFDLSWLGATSFIAS